MRTGARSEPAALLHEHGIRPRHRLGQNFLAEPTFLEKIVSAAELQKTDAVLEIGCGYGSLTSRLARVAGRVVAIELDVKLASIAREALGDLGNVQIVQGDVLKLTPEDLNLSAGYVVVGNVPYYITSPILKHLLEAGSRPSRIVLTVQKEVAERICAKPPDMSVLALSVQLYCRAQIMGAIPASAFHPKPKVDSAIVRLDSYEEPLVPKGLLLEYFRLVRAGFRQRRKVLVNALAAGLRLSAEETRQVLGRAGIDPRRRAETLTIDDWVHVAEALTVRSG